MRSRALFAIILVVWFGVGCSDRSPDRASSLFDPLDSRDVVGFFWASPLEGFKEIVPASSEVADLPMVPLVPDSTVLSILKTPAVDASRPGAIVFVDPQVYSDSLAYVLPITTETEFLQQWRGLKGMQEVDGEDLHFFANRRSIKLTSGSLLGMPQAEVKRHDYYVRIRDGFALVLPSKDADGSVRRLLDRFNLRVAHPDLNEFLSLDVDGLVGAHAESMQVLREFLARAGSGRGDEDSPLAAFGALRDVAKWALDRVTDVDHFWLARSGTTFSSKIAVKPGSPLRDDLRLFGASLEAPFSRVPDSAGWALDLAVDQARLQALITWVVDRLPATDGKSSKRWSVLGRVKRVQSFTSGTASVVLAECADEAAAKALAAVLELSDAPAGALDHPVQTQITLLSLPGTPASAVMVWAILRGAWCAVQMGGQGELLEPALAATGAGTFGAKVPNELRAGACALWCSAGGAPSSPLLPYVARIGWSGDQLLIDGRAIEGK
jgi:hypothetical protein